MSNRTSPPLARTTIAILAIVFASSATPVLAQAPKPFEAMSNSAESLRDSIVSLARAQIGTRYRLGGGSPEKGFDCSGLVKFVMSALNLDVPRTARQQAKVGLAIKRDTSHLLPGDVLTFGRGKKGAVSHVGIYVGDGRFVQASSAAGRVVEVPLDRPASRLIKVWRGARRILLLDDSTSAGTAATPPATVASKGGR